MLPIIASMNQNEEDLRKDPKSYCTQGFPKKTCAPFGRLLWRDHETNCPAFKLMDRRDFNLEAGTKFEYIWLVVADLLSKKAKLKSCLETRGF